MSPRPFLALLLLAAPAAAQAWEHQAPRPTNLDLRGVHAVSADEAWAIGDDGVLVHTVDGGATWETTSLPSTSTWTVFFLDAARGWAAGNGFFHTTDGGATWVKDNDWGTITDIRFLDAQRGWACGNGGVTYRTTDGGLTWSYTAVGPIATLRSIFFVDAQHGFTVNIDGDVFESLDGGASWSLVHASGASNLNTVRFFDSQEGWVIGGDTFLHTTDGGASWQAASVPPGTWVHGAEFADRLHGWGVGAGGGGVRTVDGGQTWVAMDTSIEGPRLWDVHFADAQNGFLVGETGVLNGSTDGGQSWDLLQSGGAGTTHGLDAVDAQHAWAANDGGEVLRTTDGHFWQRVEVPGISTHGAVNGVDFLDPQRGWAVGVNETFSGDNAVIVRSLDGGVSWTVQYQDVLGTALHAVEAIDAQRAVAVGTRYTNGGYVLRTTDGGASWQDVSPSKAAFEDVDFVDAQTGWVVGGLIYRTTDGGTTWEEQGGASGLLNGVSFADHQHGWAVGWWGTVLRTTDGGQTWTTQAVPNAPKVFFDVQAVGADRAWLVGNDRSVRHTADGGQTWTTETLAMDDLNVLEALCFVDAATGWVGGTPYAPGGGIWRRDGCDAPLAYCEGGVNSTGQSAAIGHAGSTSVGANDFTLTATGCPPGEFGLFFLGQGRTKKVLGDGYLCVSGPLTRLPVVQTDAAGTVSYTLDLTGAPGVGGAIDAGETWDFQLWYRDPGFGAGFNLTDGLEATFCR